MAYRTFVLFALGLSGLGAAGPAAAAPAVSPAGIVRFDVSSDPASLNPLFARADAGVVDQQLAHLVFEPFFDLDERGRAVPELLREIPSLANGGISADGRTLVYRLRPVVWSDGVPLTSEDVLFTLRAILDPANPVGSREGYELIDRAEALDAHTVRFHLSRPWAPAVATFFAYGTAPQYVLPAHVLKGRGPLATAPFNAAPAVGDGPYSFVSWRRGERLLYRPNARYWRGRPKLAALEVGIVPDPQTNLTLLQSGGIDFNLVAPAQLPVLARTEGLVYRDVPTALIAAVAFNLAHPPLDDPRVRRALAAGIDRRTIARKITLGKYPVAESSRPRFSWAYDASVRQPEYDPAASDAAFDAAGWRRGPDGMRAKGGIPLALTFVYFPESTTGVRAAALIEESLRLRGVALALKSVSNAQLFLPERDGGALAGGRFDLAYVPTQMGADPDDGFLLACRGAAKNYMRYCDPRIDRLEARAVSEPSQDRRRRAYLEIDRLVARDVPLLYLFNPTYVYAQRTRLHGFAPNAFTPTWNAWAWSL